MSLRTFLTLFTLLLGSWQDDVDKLVEEGHLASAAIFYGEERVGVRGSFPEPTVPQLQRLNKDMRSASGPTVVQLGSSIWHLESFEKDVLVARNIVLGDIICIEATASILVMGVYFDGNEEAKSAIHNVAQEIRDKGY